MKKIWSLVKIEQRSDGVLIETYEPREEVYIDSFCMSTGEFKRSRVLSLTVHKGVEVFELRSSNFKSFKCTKDHGLVVYDEKNDSYKRANIDEVTANKNTYYFVRNVNQQVVRVPLNDIVVVKTNDTVAYDFTVEGTYTFLINDGLAVYDTMSVYSALLPKTNESLKEKLLDPILQIHPGKWLYLIDELVTGLTYLTSVDPKKSAKFTFEDDHSFLDRCNQNGYAFLIENCNETVRIESTDVINTVGRHYLTLLLQIKAEINEPVKRSGIQYYLTRLYYLYVCKPLINNSSKREQLARTFQKIVGTVVRISSKMMNYLPVSLDTLLSNCTDLVEEYEKEIEEHNDNPEAITKKYVELIKQRNPRYSGENKLTKVLDQMLLSRGYVKNYNNKKIFIKSSYLRGLDDYELFNSAQSNRDGAVSKVISISSAGYMYRKLVYATSHIITSSDRPDDCNTELYLVINNYDVNNLFRDFLFRHIVIDDTDYFVDFDTIPKLLKKYGSAPVEEMLVRSPIICLEEQFCKTCLPPQYTYISNFIGLLSSQALSEDLAQDLMRQFHTGGKSAVSSGTTSASVNNSRVSAPMQHLEVIDKTLYAKCDIDIESIEQENYTIIIHYLHEDNLYIETITDVSSYVLHIPSETDVRVLAGEKILSYEENVLKNYVVLLDRLLQSKTIGFYELYNAMANVRCQSLYKEIVVQALYYDENMKLARLSSYQNKYRKYSVYEIPYLNKLTGLSFANLTLALKKQDKTADCIDNLFFKSIILSDFREIDCIQKKK
jgi:hypothetical protein